MRIYVYVDGNGEGIWIEMGMVSRIWFSIMIVIWIVI